MAEFDWPCHRRVAHGPHVVEDTALLDDRQLAELVIANDMSGLQCPGVKAHPNTMIGRERRG